MDDRIVLTIPGKLIYVKPVRTFVSDVARRLGFPDEMVDDVELVTDEVCNNAIEHGRSSKEEITLTCILCEDRIEIIIRDYRGAMFSPSEFRLPDILEGYERASEEEPRGLGLAIVKSLMDEVTVHTEPGKFTDVRMVKYRR
jgi:serine/threonine-protein kinase RsbW